MSARFLSVLCLSLVLLGCGNQGAGVSTESQSSRGVTQGQQLDRAKTFSSETKTVATVSIPVSPLLGELWGEMVRAEESTYPLSMCEHLWEWARLVGRVEAHEHAAAMACAFWWGYHYAFAPTIGWPVTPQSDEALPYMVGALAHILLVNNLLSDIAAQVTGRAYHNPEEAKAAMQALLTAGRAALIQVYPLLADFTLLEGVVDLAGAKDVTFSRGMYHVTLGAAGALVKYTGVDWFGNGNLSGKRYEVQLASMTGVAMTKGQAVTAGSEHTTGTGAKAQAGVGK